MKFTVYFFLLFAVIVSCTKKNSNKVKNTDVVDVVNAYGKNDTLRYVCDSCEKYITNPDILQKIINQATEETKSIVTNPLSFLPRNVHIKVVKQDSMYYFDNGKHIDSCLLVTTDYTFVSKNYYGTDVQNTNQSNIFFIGSNIKKDFLEIVRKDSLRTILNGSAVDRNLKLSDIDGDGTFSILPALKHPINLLIESSISCIDKNAILTIFFEDSSEIKMNSWNDFNCSGNAYFHLTSSHIEKLKTKKIKNISFYSDKMQFASIKKNDSDYFIQVMALLPKK
jgi:hypothetical protein